MSSDGRKLAGLSRQEQVKGLRVKRGELESVSGSTYNVLIDGDAQPTPVPAACDAKVGDRLVILCDGTVWAAIAAYR